jgi:cell division protein FtsI (penicillin-binding protein 3)
MAETPHPDAWRGTVQQRLMIVASVFALWAAAVQVRLVLLQVNWHDYYVQKAVRQHERRLPLPAMRGSIFDREGRVLATSADADTVYAVPTEIGDKPATARALCRALEDCAAMKGGTAALEEKLSQKKAFVYVKRQASPAEAKAIRALGLGGIGFTTESRRFYPNRELLAPVLGYVGIDNVGLGGLEQKYNETVRGKDGQALVLNDARRHVFHRVDRPPTAGASLELTLDASLQYVVERELAAGITEHRASGGVAIVMDPWTGEVLAMASAPTFNPNAYGEFDKEHRRNRAVADIYEPGSTFKTVTASAAIEEKVLTPETFIDCAPGHIDIGSRRVRDVHAYGSLSFTDVIVKSSNVGAIKTGFRVGSERMLRYVRRFGFGTRLSPDLPGEEPGIVWGELNDGALASVSMGYQVGVTPLQMAAAVSSIANGGQLQRPRIVRAVVRGGVRHAVTPEVIRRTVTPETAATLTAIMEGVVDRGTGKIARIDGYTIAAKTGTSAKLEDGVYSKQKYMASIVGFVPSRKPAVTVLVVVDSPRAGGYYGGVVAGPVFRRIAEAAIRHMGLPRNIDPEQPVVVARRTTDAVTPVNFGVTPVLHTGPAPGPDGVMPDLRGLSARSAVRVLARAGLAPRLVGRGVVTAQDPMAGTPLDSGASVRLRLDRELPPPPPPVDTAVQP